MVTKTQYWDPKKKKNDIAYKVLKISNHAPDGELNNLTQVNPLGFSNSKVELNCALNF